MIYTYSINDTSKYILWYSYLLYNSYLEDKKTIVEAALDASLTATNPNVDKIIESMKYSLMAGGKRIRPILCLAACEMFGKNIYISYDMIFFTLVV